MWKKEWDCNKRDRTKMSKKTVKREPENGIRMSDRETAAVRWRRNDGRVDTSAVFSRDCVCVCVCVWQLFAWLMCQWEPESAFTAAQSCPRPTAPPDQWIFKACVCVGLGSFINAGGGREMNRLAVYTEPGLGWGEWQSCVCACHPVLSSVWSEGLKPCIYL